MVTALITLEGIGSVEIQGEAVETFGYFERGRQTGNLILLVSVLCGCVNPKSLD